MSGFKNDVSWGSDFTGIYDSVVWGATNLVSGGGSFGGDLGFASVNEGSFASTVDEPGGVLAITTDTGDNDNAVLMGPKCKPSLGPAWMEARFKYSNTDCAIYVGFAETIALDSPVMPAEFATATMTYNPGGMVGFNYDVDGTTDDFRAVMGDGSAAVASSGNGTRANATVTADKYFIARVELHPDGSGTCYLADSGHTDGNSRPILRLIKKFTAGLTPTDLFYPVLMIENRSGAARVLEVDYFYGGSIRSWAA